MRAPRLALGGEGVGGRKQNERSARSSARGKREAIQIRMIRLKLNGGIDLDWGEAGRMAQEWAAPGNI